MSFFVKRAVRKSSAGLFAAAMLLGLGCGAQEELDSKAALSQETVESALAGKRVMPIGDSITQAAAGRASYRCQLWAKIRAAGRVADFVGSLTTGYNGANTCTVAGFDTNHEGHWGWRADQILANISTWAGTHRPEIALIHLGTNDLLQGQTVDSTISELSQIIDRLRAVNPNVKVFIAKIIPVNNTTTPITTFNQRIATLATSKNTTASPVIAVDQWTGFSASADTYDGVHPNPTGEAKMAERWFQAIRTSL